MYDVKLNALNNAKDEKQIEKICCELDMKVRKIMNIEPNFIFYGSKEIGYYTVTNMNRDFKKIVLHIDFRLYYPDKRYFYDNKEIKSLNHDEFDKLVNRKYNESKILYAYIQWISVNPQGKSKGSKVVKEIIEVLKEVDNIKFILLHPIDSKANNFWRKNGFVDEELNNVIDKRVKRDACKRLIFRYDIK